MQTSTRSDVIRSEFVTGLINAHALEKQARELIERQLDRVRSYPDVAARLRQHLDETNRQEERLDRLLSGMNESSSGLKDLMLKLGGNIGALMHSTADDEILKNTFANLAFENFEIASYESLLTMARMGGFGEAEQLLQQSLQEEEAMAQWIRAHVDPITRQYLDLRGMGEKADR